MMNDQTVFLNDYLATLKRRKWQLLGPAILIFLIAVGIVVSLPTLYRSNATVLIEQQEIPTDLVRSTVTSYADQRVQVIRQRVMTTQNLGQVIERHDLYADLRRDKGLGSAIEQIRSDIKLEMISADVMDPLSGRSGTTTIAFSISYQAESPTLAQRVTNDLVSLFLDENLRERKRTAQEASRFLEQESRKLSEQVSALEGRLAQFKEVNGDSIPEMMQVNLQLMQRMEDSLRTTDQEIRALEVNQIYLQSELGKLHPYTSMYSASGERIMSPADRLKVLETEFLTFSSRYSESHPDRAAIEREIEILRREVGRRDGDDIRRLLVEQRNELTSLRVRYSNEHPSIERLERQISATEQRLATGSYVSPADNSVAVITDADNPAYIQLNSQLVANQAKLDSLRRSRDEVSLRLGNFEQRIAEAPKVEREYRLITRDYESAIEKYNQVRSKHLEATLAESLESERQGERFTLIEPPLIPETPYSPNRIALLLVGFAVALGSGAGILAAREALDDGIYSVQQIKDITGSPPLAIMPVLRTEQDHRRRLFHVLFYVFLGVTAISGAAYAMHKLYRPLDVLWFQGLNMLRLT
jgi:polysaccharide biosynthesis transport protein